LIEGFPICRTLIHYRVWVTLDVSLYDAVFILRRVAIDHYDLKLSALKECLLCQVLKAPVNKLKGIIQ
jgi:hypothetical protein